MGVHIFDNGLQSYYLILVVVEFVDMYIFFIIFLMAQLIGHFFVAA